MSALLERHIPRLHELSYDEKCALLTDLSLEVQQEPRPDIPDWHLAILQERLAAHEADPQAAIPWSEVKESVLAKLRTP
ncbi:MAG: addiction module protein [Betaproteobacteria bacterium]|nr:addiction module protein [Betaproteobacteria bacterium]